MESLFNLAKSHFAKWVWLYDIVLPPFLFGTMHHFMRAIQLKRYAELGLIDPPPKIPAQPICYTRDQLFICENVHILVPACRLNVPALHWHASWCVFSRAGLCAIANLPFFSTLEKRMNQ